MIVVAGPRIDSAGLPGYNGLEVRAYAPHLYRHLAACDLAIVQGGLTTCMELVDTAGRFSTSPSLTTSSRPSNVTHASTTTERAARWTTPAATPTPSPPRSAAPSTTVRSRPTAPPRCPPHRRTSVSTRLGAGPPPPVLAAQQQTTRPDTKASGPFQIGASRSHPSSLWLRSPPAREAMRSLTAVR